MPRGRKKKEEPKVEYKPESDKEEDEVITIKYTPNGLSEFDPRAFEKNPYDEPLINPLVETLKTILGEAPELPWTYTAQEIEDYRREYEVWKSKIRANLR